MKELDRDIFLDKTGAMTFDEAQGVTLHLAAGSYLRYPEDIAFVDADGAADDPEPDPKPKVTEGDEVAEETPAGKSPAKKR